MSRRTITITPHGFIAEPHTRRYALDSTGAADVQLAVQRIQQARLTENGILAEPLDLLASGLLALLAGKDDEAARYADLTESRMGGLQDHLSAGSGFLLRAGMTVLRHHLSGGLPMPLRPEALQRYTQQLQHARQDTAGLPPEVAQEAQGAFDMLLQCYSLVGSGGEVGADQIAAMQQQARGMPGGLRSSFEAAFQGLLGHLAAGRVGGASLQAVRPDPQAFDSTEGAHDALMGLDVGNNVTDAYAKQHAQGALAQLLEAKQHLAAKRFGDAYAATRKAQQCCRQARNTRTQHPVITGAITRVEQECAPMPEDIRHAARTFTSNQLGQHRRKNSIAHNHLARAHQEALQGIDAASTHPAGSKQTAMMRATQSRQLAGQAVALGASPEEFAKVDQAASLIKQLADERFNR